MKLEELFNTIHSAANNPNGNFTVGPSPTSPTTSQATTLLNNASQSDASLNQLLDQLHLSKSNAQSLPQQQHEKQQSTLFESSLSNQSSHSLLDGLLKSPDSTQNGIMFDDPLMLRLLNSKFDTNFINGATTESLSSTIRDTIPTTSQPNTIKESINPLASSLLNHLNQPTLSANSANQTLTNQTASQISRANSGGDGANSQSNSNFFNAHPFNPYFPYQSSPVPLPPQSPFSFGRYPGPFSPVPPTLPGVGSIPTFPSPFSPLRPSVAPFPSQEQLFSQGPFQNAPPFPYSQFYSPNQHIAYQQYFAYYYNALNNLNQPNNIHQQQQLIQGIPSFNEFSSESTSIGPESSLSSVEGRNHQVTASETIIQGSPPKKPVRVNVNDLFSFTQAYSDGNLSKDPNILSEFIQRQKGEQNTEMPHVVRNGEKKKKHTDKKNNRNKLSELLVEASRAAGDVPLRNKQLKNAKLLNGTAPHTDFLVHPSKELLQSSNRTNDTPLSTATMSVDKKVPKKLKDTVKNAPPPSNQPSGSQQQKAPKELTIINENFCMDLLKQLRKELLTTKDPIPILNRTYDWKKLNYMYTIIKQYFNHLEQRLRAENVTYLNLIDSSQYVYDDFAAYGSRFWDYINESMLFPLETITKYSLLIKNYEELYPKEIVEMRTKLLAIKLELSESMSEKSELKPQPGTSANSDELENDPTNDLVDYEMVTYRQIDSKRLHINVSRLGNVRDQINFFLNTVCLSDEGRSHRDAFIECLNKVLRESKLNEFGPELHKFGSLSNGLGTYDSDLDIVIKFKNIAADILDYSTSMLALEVIELILQEQLGIRSKDTIVPSKRCPIIKLNFSVCFPQFKKNVRNELRNRNQHVDQIEFNKCDISLITVYGVYNSRMLNFLAKYDRRFYEMALILKYWAKKNELIDTTAFSTYGFTMMIIFFLQNTNPPVLPQISKLQRLGKKQPGKEEIKVHKYNFEFCDDVDMIGKSKNMQTTQELLVDFFRFYIKFDFYNYAISPRHGQAIKKIKLRQEKIAQKLDSNFNMSSYICIEDPFVLEHNVGFIFRARNIYRWNNLLRSALYKLTNNNCLKVLVDPNNFQSLRSGPSMIYLPFNLFCHKLTLPAKSIFPTPSSAIKLREVSEADVQHSIQTMKEFFYLAIRHLLVDYLTFPHHPSAFQLELAPEGVTCAVDFGYLSHINYKLDFRSTPKYDALFQNSRKRTSDCAKRFTLLKDLREDLRRPPNAHNLRDRPVKPMGYMDKWFKIEVAHHPPVHQSQISQASYQALVEANNLHVPFFIFRPLFQSNDYKFTTANKFGEMVFEVLHQFNYSIDRSCPVETFNAYVQEFFAPD